MQSVTNDWDDNLQETVYVDNVYRAVLRGKFADGVTIWLAYGFVF